MYKNAIAFLYSTVIHKRYAGNLKAESQEQ